MEKHVKEPGCHVRNYLGALVPSEHTNKQTFQRSWNRKFHKPNQNI